MFIPLGTAAGGADHKAPSAPTNLRLTSTTTSSLSVAWDAAKDNKGGTQLSGYSVYLTSPGNTPVTPLAVTTKTSYDFTALACGTTFLIGVDAYDTSGNRSPITTLTASTAACAPPVPAPTTTTTTTPTTTTTTTTTTPTTTTGSADTTPPTAPTNVSVATATATAITLKWTAATDNVGVAGYGAYRAATAVGSATTTTYSFGGLACGTAYALGVDAFDAAGNRSARVSVTASTSPCDTTAPTPPTGLLETAATTSSISVSWGPSFDDVGVVGYGLYRNGTAVGSTGSTVYTITGLACGSSYTIAVDSYDAAGNRSTPASVVAATSPCPDLTPPTTPTGLTKTSATTTSVSISWAPSSDNVAVAGYGVYQGSARVATASTAAATLSGLSCGTSYALGVDAFDAAGNRSPIATLSATTASCTTTPPPTPQPLGPTGPWTLAFDDEFDGTSLDTSKWAPCWFPGSFSATSDTCGSMNNVTSRKSNVKVANGEATLTLSSSSDGALISTNPHGGATTGYEFQYGVTEARVWFPGSGTSCFDWPGWWTDGQSWPADGEHDIAEVLSGQMTVNYHSSSGSHNQGAVAGAWCGGYHVYTLNRQLGHADVYFDGSLVKSYTTDDTGNPHYLILNIGSGGVASVPAQLKVDYVRAWHH